MQPIKELRRTLEPSLTYDPRIHLWRASIPQALFEQPAMSILNSSC
jgi:hypothetical protein